MNVFRKLLLRMSLGLAEKAQYTMHQIDAMRHLALDTLDKKWSLKEYQNLEKARLLAQGNEHWFEELQILVDQVSLIIRERKEKELFYVANKRLLELSDVFSMDDEAFALKFNEKYRCFTNANILAQVDQFLRILYEYFDRKADFMLAHLQYNTAILCGKAICKIASISHVVSFEEHIETLFQIAISYGNIREFSKAMEYYNKALHLSQDANDQTYVYISITRKLSTCIASVDFSVYADVDNERIAVIQELLALCDKYKLKPYELGKKLLREEKTDYRKNRIEEAMPLLDNLLAYERGDWQTASRSNIELKEAESKTYGANTEYSNADTLKFVYNLLHNPVAREQETDNTLDEGIDDVGDIPYIIPFPQGMRPSDKFNICLILSKTEIAGRHPNCSISLAKQAMLIARDVFSDYHIAMSFHLIGQAYKSTGNAIDAIDAFKSVVELFNGENQRGSDLCLSKQLMYNCLLELGDLQRDVCSKEAINIYSEALKLIEESTDIDKGYFELCTKLSRSSAYKNIDEILLAEQDLSQAADMILAETSKRLRYMDGELRENYWSQTNKIIQRIVSLSDENDSLTLHTKLYELILLSKGFLLSSEHSLKTAISLSDVPEEIRRIYEELEEYEQKRNPWGTSTEDSSDEYVNHYLQRMRLTCAMRDIIADYTDFINQDYNSIADELKESDVVVDFYNYEIDNNDQQYIAIAYKKGSDLNWFKVCKESDIQCIFNEVAASSHYTGCQYHFTEAYNPNLEYSNRLYNCILKPVVDKLGIDSSFNMYIVPSGSLHVIPIESLVVANDSSSVTSDYYKSFVRISHARAIKNKRVHEPLMSIELFGGLDYGYNVDTNSDNRGDSFNHNIDKAAPILPWKALHHSLSEVKNIEFMWAVSKGKTSISLYTHREGTADQFYKLNGKHKSVIHFATHCFFETRETADSIPALKGRFCPMDLSGIILSDGNQGWLYGSPLSHEGILTSSDIAKMDLRGISLVVLSGCYSGTGDVRADDFYGLQRAFKKAGVKCVVMSLWNESDEAGTMFMTKFYGYLLFDNLSLTDSFNKAKNEIRKCYGHPFFWANFVMID